MQESFTSVDTAFSINHHDSLMVNFVINWSCNLDCTYCTSHDNSLKPVEYDQVKRSIDFIFKYSKTILSIKRKHARKLAINFIGGEPMIHPNVIEILVYLKEQYKKYYKDDYHLSVCMTSNATFGSNILSKCLPYIDLWTLSYHTEANQKQKDLVLKNIKKIKDENKRLQVRVIAPEKDELFFEASSIHKELLDMDVNALLKPCYNRMYDADKTGYLKTFWIGQNLQQDQEYKTDRGTTCCAERPLNVNNDRKKQVTFLQSNRFHTWYCGLMFRYLYVDWLGRIYQNSVCQISYETNLPEPIGHVDNYELVLENLNKKIEDRDIPVIVCPYETCTVCGMCAPKAKNKEEFTKIMKINLEDVNILNFSTHDSIKNEPVKRRVQVGK